MSKPMTEARLAEIEIKQTLLERAECGSDFVRELITEVRRLQEYIAKAPHAEITSVAHDIGSVVREHNKVLEQWKREALGE